MSNSIQVFTAEAIATFALCFVGVLSIAAAGDSLVTVALAHGLTIAVMVAAVGSVSGAHINPAVTFGFVVTGRMKPATAVLYWGAQLVGAAVAGFLLLGILDGSVLASASAEGAKGLVAGGTPQLSGVEMLSGILLEAVATFFLVFVVFGTAVSERAPKSVFPFAIGLTVTLGIMAIGPMTGGALNPARHFGPALASGMWENVAVYWIGPLLGGALGGAVQHFILMKQAPISSD
ncbi:MAG: aquaporin [Ignavibacteriae bacterium]|nr:aquaporin [Ignavibacteriota bacterium]MCB9216651.1 aquaporin [Ignavibacteria bacterium]